GWSPIGFAPAWSATGIFLPRSGPFFVAVICDRGAAAAWSGPRVVVREAVAGVGLQFHFDRPAWLVEGSCSGTLPPFLRRQCRQRLRRTRGPARSILTASPIPPSLTKPLYC